MTDDAPEEAPEEVASFSAESDFTAWTSGGKGLFLVCALLGSMYAGKALSLVWPGLEPMLPFFAALGLLALGVVQAGSDLEIGSDGLRHAWLGRSRFIRWREVARITRWVSESEKHLGLRLVLKSGKVIILSVAEKYAPAEADRALACATAGFAKYGRGHASQPLAPLERGSRDGVAWVRHLRSLGAGSQADARTNHVGADALLSVVEDAEQPPVARVSAVVAMASQLSPEERDRVRVIAGGTLDDSFRIAIQTALDPDADEEAVSEALAELEHVADRT